MIIAPAAWAMHMQCISSSVPAYVGTQCSLRTDVCCCVIYLHGHIYSASVCPVAIANGPGTAQHRLRHLFSNTTCLVAAGTLQQQQQSYSSWQQLQQRQQQGQMTGSPLLAAYSQVSTLNHPSTIPLQLEDNAVRDAAGNVLLDNINSNLVTLNSRESQHGALVLGASSEHGPASCWDLTVGKVRLHTNIDSESGLCSAVGASQQASLRPSSCDCPLVGWLLIGDHVNSMELHPHSIASSCS